MQRSKNMKIAINCFYIALFLAFVGYYGDVPSLGNVAILGGIIAFGVYFYLAAKEIKSRSKHSK